MTAPAAASAPLISVRELSKTFGGRFGRRFRALDGVSLEVGRGTVFGLLGPNGAGKTTLIKILMGLVPGWTGEARVFGERAGAREPRARIGFLPEAQRLPSYLTGRQLLLLFGMLSGRSRAWVEERIPDWLARVDMEKHADRKLREYSKGMQQRIGLAQALMHEPELVFLDEPTAGVDPGGRRSIRGQIADLRAAGVCVLVTTHELEEAERVADRVVIMDHGRVVASGSPAELAGLDPAGGGIRFAGPPGLDTAGLARELQAEVREDTAGQYVVAAAGEPGTVALVTAWLARHDIAIRDLRTAARLEDVFLRLTGGDT